MSDGVDPRAVKAVHRAAALVEAGDVAGARARLAEALDANPGHAPAWRWLASLVDTDAERKFCLERAPDRGGRRLLKALRGVEAAPPAEVAWLVEPPAPPLAPGPAARSRRWWVVPAAVLTAAVLVAGAVWVGWWATRPEPAHLAFAGGFTGAGADYARHALEGARMAVDEANRSGGIGGRRVELLVHDDADDPDLARQRAEEVVRDGRALAVIGHGRGETSRAAAPVYAAAGLPAITPTATTDGLTADNPWYFRTVFADRDQSRFLAAYLAHVTGARRASVVSDGSEYGRGAGDDFTAAFSRHGTVERRLVVGGTEESVRDAVTALGPDPGPVVLAAHVEVGVRTITALRAAGVAAPVFVTDALAADTAHDSLLRSLSEHRPGLGPGELRGITPMAVDALTGRALGWADEFERTHGHDPTWQAATAYDAATALVRALRDARPRFGDADRAGDRRSLRDALAALDVPEGLLGPIRFDADRTADREIAVVESNGSRYVSSPVQLVPHVPRPGEATDAEVAAGRLVDLDGDLLARRQVVGAGVRVNHVDELDDVAGTFRADFFLWLKYVGDDTATDVVFENAVDPRLTPGEPVQSVSTGSEDYRLYRVVDDFKADFDFRDFPFDSQDLRIVLRHRDLPESRLVYVTDEVLLDQARDERLRAGADLDAGIDRIPDWTPTEVLLHRDSVGSDADLGDPTAAGPGSTRHSRYVADVRIHRDAGSFLLRNLIQLGLLALLTYLALFFPAGGEVVPNAVLTIVLAAAVLLTTVLSSLPRVTYTVAIEWAYYAFLALSTVCLLATMLRMRFAAAGRHRAAGRVITAVRVAYPVLIAAVVLGYLLAYG